MTRANPRDVMSAVGVTAFMALAERQYGKSGALPLFLDPLQSSSKRRWTSQGKHNQGAGNHKQATKYEHQGESVINVFEPFVKLCRRAGRSASPRTGTSTVVIPHTTASSHSPLP